MKNNTDIRKIEFTRNKTIIYDWKSGKITVKNGRITRKTK